MFVLYKDSMSRTNSVISVTHPSKLFTYEHAGGQVNYMCFVYNRCVLLFDLGTKWKTGQRVSLVQLDYQKMMMELEEDVYDDENGHMCNRYSIPMTLTLDKTQASRLKSFKKEDK